jgi:DNA-3-methyladenine glycosylase II
VPRRSSDLKNSRLWDTGELQRAVEHLRSSDPKMRRIVEVVGECLLHDQHPGDPFGALCESVLHQQLAGAAARSITRRFIGLFGDRHPTPAELAAIDDQTLRGVGLSGGKVRTLRALTEAFLAEATLLESLATMPESDVRQKLTRIKGIGPWTVDMLMIFHLGLPDVYPVGDLGVRKAIQRAYGLEALPGPAEMEKIGKPWQPYRTVAAWYLWRSLGAGGI